MTLKDFWYGMLNGWGMNDRASRKLDIILIYMENIGIKSIDIPKNYFGEDGAYIDIEFNDGTVMSAWNANRWYAWLSQGTINFSNGEKLDWNGTRPRHEIIYKLKKIVKKWEKTDDEDLSKYLPKGYAKRMERLKKLKELEKKGLI